MATLWRYKLGGTVLHEISAYFDRYSHCGVTVMNFSDWRGTGTQDEYDKAAAMAKCQKCVNGRVAR